MLKRVVVVGGGITGLTTMHYLQKLKKSNNLDVDLILVEKSPHLGGKIHTVKDGEFIIETGADSIVTRHESVKPFIDDLGLQEQVVYNATGISYIYTNNVLKPIPADTIFGIPMSEESLQSSTLISEEGKREALKDFELPNTNFTKDSSIGDFLEYFLGSELVEKQIAPVLSGVYSGEISQLTLASTLPYLLDYKNQYGSIMKGLGENKKKFQSLATKKFLSFNDGLSTIIDSLEEQLTDVTFLKGVQTTNITKRYNQYQITFSNHPQVQADYVVMTTPHQVTQSILNDSQLDSQFRLLKDSSLISVYLGFDIPDSDLPADGTGFIVSGRGNILCDACTWTSRKWSHTSKHNRLLIRLFYKSTNPAYASLVKLEQQGLVKTAMSDIEKSLGIKGTPKTVQITNWDQLMPNYHMTHNQAVESLSNKIQERFPRIFLAGASYYGVGIGACIKNGKDIAEMIAEQLQSQ